MKISLPARLKNISPAAWLTSFYLVSSVIWILGSDSLAFNLSNGNTELLRELQQKKGLFFVGLTAVMIYFMSNTFYLRLKNSFRKYKGLEANYHALNEATREGIFDCDLGTMTARLNTKMQFFLPGSFNSIDNFWEIFKNRIAPRDRRRLIKEYEEVISSAKLNWQTEYRLLGEDNIYYTVLSSIYIIRNKNNDALRLIGAIQDVSDLRNLQAEYYREQISHKQKLAASIIEAQETEKNRWAEELHDNVCQLLSVAKLNLSAVESMPGSANALSAEAKKLVTESISEIRQLSASLKPPVFEDNLLVESIEQLTQDIQRVDRIEFCVNALELDETKLTDAHRILIYRVVQEQLTNITKYAKATKVSINLSGKGKHFMIRISDNGVGFDHQKIKSGIGLRNIQSRLQVYRGTMNIISAPGEGCSLEAEFSV